MDTAQQAIYHQPYKAQTSNNPQQRSVQPSQIQNSQQQQIPNQQQTKNNQSFSPKASEKQFDYAKQASKKQYTLRENAHKESFNSKMSQHHNDKPHEVRMIGQIAGKYNFLMIPPDESVAEKHGEAMRIATPLKQEELTKLYQQQPISLKTDINEKLGSQNNSFHRLDEEEHEHKKPKVNKLPKNIEECECCSYQIQRKQMSLCCNSRDLEFLGSGYPLLFNFIQGCFSIMTIYFFTSGAFSLFTNINGNFCNVAPHDEEGCQNNFFNHLSQANKHNQPNEALYSQIQSYLNSGSAFLLMIFMIYFRKKQREIDSQIDSQSTPADFSIMVRNIPRGLEIDYESELLHVFQNHSHSKDTIDVSSVTVVYDMKFINQLKHSLQEALKRKREFLEEKEARGIFYCKQPYSLEYTDSNFEIKSILDRIIKTIKFIKREPKYFLGYAFISFDTELQRDKVLNDNEHTEDEKERYISNNNKLFYNDPKEKDFLFNGYKILMKKALEPKDINWDGFAEKGLNRRHGRIKSFLQSAALALLSFVILLILTLVLEGYIDAVYESPNLLAVNIVPKIIKWEKQVSNTNRTISHASKLAVMSFMNSAIIDFAICTVISHNYWKKGGFIQIQTVLAILNIFFAPTVNIINREYHNKLKEKKEIQEQLEINNCFLTQEQLNQAFENPAFEIADVYADLINTMWISFLYSPLIPIILLCSMLNLAISYWVQKYTLLRRSTVKEVLSMDVSIHMIELIEYIIILHAIGNLIFTYQLFQTVNYFSVINCVLGFIYTILPMQTLNEKLWKFDHEKSQLNWKDAVDKKVFEQTYDEVNPVNELLKKAEKAIQTLEEDDRRRYLTDKALNPEE